MMPLAARAVSPTKSHCDVEPPRRLLGPDRRAVVNELRWLNRFRRRSAGKRPRQSEHRVVGGDAVIAETDQVMRP
jgi:hypothetical protein